MAVKTPESLTYPETNAPLLEPAMAPAPAEEIPAAEETLTEEPIVEAPRANGFVYKEPKLEGFHKRNFDNYKKKRDALIAELREYLHDFETHLKQTNPEILPEFYAGVEALPGSEIEKFAEGKAFMIGTVHAQADRHAQRRGTAERRAWHFVQGDLKRAPNFAAIKSQEDNYLAYKVRTTFQAPPVAAAPEKIEKAEAAAEAINTERTEKAKSFWQRYFDSAPSRALLLALSMGAAFAITGGVVTLPYLISFVISPFISELSSIVLDRYLSKMHWGYRLGAKTIFGLIVGLAIGQDLKLLWDNLPDVVHQQLYSLADTASQTVSGLLPHHPSVETYDGVIKELTQNHPAPTAEEIAAATGGPTINHDLPPPPNEAVVTPDAAPAPTTPDVAPTTAPAVHDVLNAPIEAGPNDGVTQMIQNSAQHGGGVIPDWAQHSADQFRAWAEHQGIFGPDGSPVIPTGATGSFHADGSYWIDFHNHMGPQMAIDNHGNVTDVLKLRQYR